jgi:prevent-host-death family protein
MPNQLTGAIMREVGAFEAKTHLSALLEAVEADEEVLITRRGKPVARLVPARPARVRFGSLKGIVAPPSDDIFAPMGEDELRAWEGQ